MVLGWFQGVERFGPSGASVCRTALAEVRGDPAPTGRISNLGSEAGLLHGVQFGLLGATSRLEADPADQRPYPSAMTIIELPVSSTDPARPRHASVFARRNMKRSRAKVPARAISTGRRNSQNSPPPKPKPRQTTDGNAPGPAKNIGYSSCDPGAGKIIEQVRWLDRFESHLR